MCKSNDNGDKRGCGAVLKIPQLQSSFFHEHGSGSSFCSLSHINIFNCLCVPQIEWKMNYAK